MNGVLAHEAKEVDIIKLAGLVTREMMEIAKPRIAFIFYCHDFFKKQIRLLSLLVHHWIEKKETVDHRYKDG